MLNATLERPVPAPERYAEMHFFPDQRHDPGASAQGCQTDRQFISLLDAYRSSGGLAPAQEVFGIFHRRGRTDVATLAGWIINRKVICFDWQSRMWLPLFQFGSLDMTPLPGLDQVLAELVPDHDALEVAQWFAQPNAWLANETPADRLATDLAAVLHAVRTGEFVVRH